MGTEVPIFGDASLNTHREGTSQKKIESNRRNARHSSGPKSPRGKGTVSHNARKHGLLVKNVVITSGDLRENQAEFDDLLAGMRDCHKPVGVAEDLLVQEIAISYWRSGRALRCERGNLTSHTTIRTRAELTQVDELMIKLRGDEARFELLGSSHRLNYVLQKVEEIRKDLELSGRISQESCEWLSLYLVGRWDEIAGKQELLWALGKKIAELNTRKGQVEEDELRQKNAWLDRASVPSKEALDRIQRYETANVRHRYRLMAMLEQLLSQRKGTAGVGGLQKS